MNLNKYILHFSDKFILHFYSYKRFLNMKEWMFCNGLKKNGTLWLEVFRIYYHNPELRKNKKKNLKYLACFKYPDLIHMYMDPSTLIPTYMPENPTGLINSFHIIVARHAKNAAILDYILNNMYRIKPRYVYFSSRIYSVCNQNSLNLLIT